MIDEYYTWIFYGYHSDELKPQSHKKVVVICDECRKYRISRYYGYHDLCHSCAQIKRLEDPKERLKHSIGTRKRYEDPKERLKQSIVQRKHYQSHPDRSKRHSEFMNKNHPMKDKHHLDETKDKLSKANTGINHPQFGKSRSAKTKCKISASHQGIPLSKWEGFITKNPYCSKFNESLKQSIRDRYNNCDYMSGIHKNICSPDRELSVHHVDYNKQQGCDSEWKLIPLSQVNHARTNTNRWFWNRLFTYSLQYEAEYYEDE